MTPTLESGDVIRAANMHKTEDKSIQRIIPCAFFVMNDINVNKQHAQQTDSIPASNPSASPSVSKRMPITETVIRYGIMYISHIVQPTMHAVKESAMNMVLWLLPVIS